MKRLPLSASVGLVLAMSLLAGCCRPDIQSIAATTKPAGLRATFLGVSTILLDDGETAIMTDGFFSRPSVGRAMLAPLRPNERRIDEALAKANIKQLAAILTAHSHYDHAMDTPTVAARTGAVIVGSRSTANIALGAGFPQDRLLVVQGREQLDTFGRFKIRIVTSPHARTDLFPEDIKEPLRPPARIADFRTGENYSFLIEHDGRRILIHPSANAEASFLRGERVDVVFLGIGVLAKEGAPFMREYWRTVVRDKEAKLVIPIHWDNFFTSLDRPLEPMPKPLDDIPAAMKAIESLASEDRIPVHVPAAFEVIDLDRLPP